MMQRLRSAISLALFVAAPIWLIEIGIGIGREGWPQGGWLGALVALGLIQLMMVCAVFGALVALPKGAQLDRYIERLWAQRAEPGQAGEALAFLAYALGALVGGLFAMKVPGSLKGAIATPMYAAAVQALGMIACWLVGLLLGRRLALAVRPLGGPRRISPAYLVVAAAVLGLVFYLALWWQRDLIFKEIDPWPIFALGLISVLSCAIAVFAHRLRTASGLAVLASVGFMLTLVLGFGRSPVIASSLSGTFALSSVVAEHLRARIDFDGDGVSSWFGGGDCGPLDPMTFPGAIDFPDDGIDQDCFAGDLLSSQKGLDLTPRFAPQVKDKEPELLVLVSVDALRPDFMGMYGYSKFPTSPKIDRWAKQAVVFDSAYTTGPYTTIAIPSLLTGLGMGQMPGYIGNLFEERVSSPTVKLPASVETLAETLKKAGYQTGAIVSGFDIRQNAFNQGFDQSQVITTRSLDTADKVTAAARQWLADHPSGKRFLWLHYFDPHDPYFHGLEPNFGRSTRARYASSIAFMDHHLGDLLNELGEQPKTTVALVSDHGESLGEKGRFGHGFNMHRHETRVVLAWRGEGLQPRRIGGAVSLVDVAPTLMNLAGVQPRPSAGYSLLGQLRGGPESPQRAVLTESYRRGQHFTVTTQDWRLFYHLDQNRYELFNARLDRGEVNNLADAKPEQVAKLREQLLQLMNRGGTFVRRGQQVRELIADEVPSDALLEKPVRFGDAIELIGYQFEQGGSPDQPQHVATLYLRALRRMETSWKVAFGLKGPRPMNKDHFPGRSYFPTNQWPPGVIIKDPVILGTMSKFPPARWSLSLGFYAGDKRLQPSPDGSLNLTKSGTRAVLADDQMIRPMPWAVERDRKKLEQKQRDEEAKKAPKAAEQERAKP